MTSRTGAELPDDWAGGWEAEADRQRLAWLESTPSQRLAWLERALAFAHTAGALGQRRAEGADSPAAE